MEEHKIDLASIEWVQAGQDQPGRQEKVPLKLPPGLSIRAVSDKSLADMHVDGEYWPYGIEPNRRTLEAFLRYAYEQGVCHHLLKPDELFPPQVRGSYRV